MKPRVRKFQFRALLMACAVFVETIQGGGCANRSAVLRKNGSAANVSNSPRAQWVSFYRVPLACPAAPGIGCGSASKPLLLGREASGIVSEAWLNRPGTILAVVWSENSTRGRRLGSVKAALKKQGLSAKELSGNDKQQAFKDFESRTGWYRGAEVDRLSEEEAAVIAARWVNRIRQKVSVPDQETKTPQDGFTMAVKRKLFGQSTRMQTEEEMLNICRQHLGEKEVRVLREAFTGETQK